MLKKTFLFLLVSIILASCSTSHTFNSGPFQKRKYNKGVYFNSKSKIKKTSGKEIVSVNSEIEDQSSLEKRDNNNNEDKEKNSISLSKVKDNITQALLSEINNLKRKSDLPLTASNDKADYTAPLLTNNDFYLTADTTKGDYARPNMYEPELPLHLSSKIGLVLFWVGIAGLFIGFGLLLLIAGYFFSEHGLSKAKRNPELYSVGRAEWWTKAYRILGIILLVLALLVVLLFVLILFALAGII